MVNLTTELAHEISSDPRARVSAGFMPAPMSPSPSPFKSPAAPSKVVPSATVVTKRTMTPEGSRAIQDNADVFDVQTVTLRDRSEPIYGTERFRPQSAPVYKGSESPPPFTATVKVPTGGSYQVPKETRARTSHLKVEVRPSSPQRQPLSPSIISPLIEPKTEKEKGRRKRPSSACPSSYPKDVTSGCTPVTFLEEMESEVSTPTHVFESAPMKLKTDRISQIRKDFASSSLYKYSTSRDRGENSRLLKGLWDLAIQTAEDMEELGHFVKSPDIVTLKEKVLQDGTLSAALEEEENLPSKLPGGNGEERSAETEDIHVNIPAHWSAIRPGHQEEIYEAEQDLNVQGTSCSLGDMREAMPAPINYAAKDRSRMKALSEPPKETHKEVLDSPNSSSSFKIRGAPKVTVRRTRNRPSTAPPKRPTSAARKRLSSSDIVIGCAPIQELDFNLDGPMYVTNPSTGKSWHAKGGTYRASAPTPVPRGPRVGLPSNKELPPPTDIRKAPPRSPGFVLAATKKSFSTERPISPAMRARETMSPNHLQRQQLMEVGGPTLRHLTAEQEDLLHKTTASVLAEQLLGRSPMSVTPWRLEEEGITSEEYVGKRVGMEATGFTPMAARRERKQFDPGNFKVKFKLKKKKGASSNSLPQPRSGTSIIVSDQ